MEKEPNAAFVIGSHLTPREPTMSDLSAVIHALQAHNYEAVPCSREGCGALLIVLVGHDLDGEECIRLAGCRPAAYASECLRYADPLSGDNHPDLCQR